MNNFEKVKQMTVEEMAKWLDCISSECSEMCTANYTHCNLQSTCQENIKQWLLAEVKQ